MSKFKLTGLILIALLTLIYADAVIETSAKLSVIGGLGSFESSSKTEIKGLKKSEDATVKMTGGILSAVAGKPQRQVTVTRLDKGVIWNINHNEKTYLELPIAFLEMPSEQPAMKEQKKEKEKSEYEIVKSEFSVKNTGNKKSINNFPCGEYVANWVLELMKIETKEKTRSTMTINLWTTPKTDVIKGLEKQENEFNKQLFDKMGMKISPDEMKRFGTEFITSMFTMKQDDVNKKMVNLKEEMQKIEGYPIVTEISWTIEGDTLKAKEEEESQEEAETEMPSGLGKMLAKPMAPKKGEKKEPGKAEPAFYSYNEVKSIKLSEVPEKNFEVPEGYNLVK
ncbi:MAG: hypothetical protein ACETVX_00590 [bacterium]